MYFLFFLLGLREGTVANTKGRRTPGLVYSTSFSPGALWRREPARRTTRRLRATTTRVQHQLTERRVQGESQ